MKKNIIFLGLCFTLLILYSGLSAFFAISIAEERFNCPNQVHYKYICDSTAGIKALKYAQLLTQRYLIDFGMSHARKWDIVIRESTEFTGDFSIARGYFAIVKWTAINESDKDLHVDVLGVGVSAESECIAFENAKKDLDQSVKNINKFIFIGALESRSICLLELGEF